jgi:uncharacterized membrane protein
MLLIWNCIRSILLVQFVFLLEGSFRVSALLTENAALHQVTFAVYGIGISIQRCKRASGLRMASYTGHVIIITFLNAEKEIIKSTAPSGDSFSPHISDNVCMSYAMGQLFLR